MNSVPGQEAPLPRPHRWEPVAVLLLLSAFFAFNLVTCDYYPAVWCDEVLFSEPAINLVKHGTFTTTVWEYNPANTFPVVNCPLYSMALVPWLAATGTTLLAVRSLNYALMATVALLVWLASRRFGVVQSPWARLMMVALVHLGYGMSYSYRCSRPDILGMLCLLLLLFAFAIRRRRHREICLLALAAVSVWIGFQVALFAAFASCAAWLLLRRVRFRDLIVLGLGMLIGAGSLILLLSWHGVLSGFHLSVIGLIGKNYAHSRDSSVAAAFLRMILRTPVNYLSDFSTLALNLGLVILLATGWKRLSSAARRLALYCLLLVLAVPFLFNLVGHYAFYYSYLRFAPATLGLFGVYSALVPAGAPVRTGLRFVFFTAVAVAGLVGLPLRLAFTFTFVDPCPRSEIRRIVSSRIHPADVVFSDYASFFEIKEVARLVYDPYFSSTLVPRNVPGLDFTDEEKRAISVLVIRPEQLERLAGFFGGKWSAVSDRFGETQDVGRMARVPIIGSRLAHYAAQPQNERYQLQIFRRSRTSPETPAAARPSPEPRRRVEKEIAETAPVCSAFRVKWPIRSTYPSPI